MTSVYLFKSSLGYYKIGISENVPRRLKQFSKLPFDVEYVYHKEVKYPRMLEHSLHKMYKNYRIDNGGEWFSLSLEDVINVMEIIQKS